MTKVIKLALTSNRSEYLHWQLIILDKEITEAFWHLFIISSCETAYNEEWYQITLSQIQLSDD